MKVGKRKRVSANFVALIFFATMTSNIAGCGSSNMGSAFNQSVGGSGGSGFTGGTGTTGANIWAGVPTQGVGSGPVFNNVVLFNIDTVNEIINISIPIGVDLGSISGTVPISQLPGATVGVGSDPNTGLGTIVFSIPLRDLTKKVTFGNPAALPNGNPLPGIPAGELPHLEASINAGKVAFDFYGNVKYFAIFYPTPKVNPTINLTFPIKNSAGTEVLGYISSVAAVGNFPGGVFFSLVFPPELSAVLDTLFN